MSELKVDPRDATLVINGQKVAGFVDLRSHENDVVLPEAVEKTVDEFVNRDRPKRLVRRKDAQGVMVTCAWEELRRGDVFEIYHSDGSPVAKWDQCHLLADSDCDGDGLMVYRPTDKAPQ